ncbi:MAG: NUDIX hydrolase [Planctomycetota bacterium]|nr:NUDIX hydrolase [Planctomycetota bacterium]
MSRAVQRQQVYESRVFNVEECSFLGQEGSEIVRSVIRHPGAVLIVPILSDGRFVLVRNWRVAVDQALLEFPAGTLEQGESPLVTAERELREETGYKAGSMEPLGSFFTSPGFADELMHVFLAGDLEEGMQRLEPHEEIEVVILSPVELSNMVASGTMVDGKSLAAMHLMAAGGHGSGGD